MNISRRAYHNLLQLTLPPPPRWLAPPGLGGLLLVVGLAIAWLPLRELAFLAGGLGLVGLVLSYPVLGLYLLVPLIPFSSEVTLTVGGTRVGAMEGLVALTALSYLLKLMRDEVPLRWGPLFGPFVLFIGAVSLSWLTAFSIRASLVETIKWVEMLVLYVITVSLVDRRHWPWFIGVILLAGAAQAGLGLYQFVFKVGPPGFLLFGGQFLRAYGTFDQPNPYAGYLGLVLPLALALTDHGLSRLLARRSSRSPGGERVRGTWRTDPTSQVSPSAGRGGGGGPRDDAPPPYDYPSPPRGEGAGERPPLASHSLLLTPYFLIAAAGGLMLAALFASQSRSGWVAFSVAAAVTLAARSRRNLALLTAGGLLVVSTILLGSFDWQGLNTLDNPITRRLFTAAEIMSIADIAPIEVTDENFSTIERLAHWQAAREMWRDHLWLGVGFGNYAAIYPAYAIGRWLDPLGHAHNYLLNLGAEAGLVGITAYLIFWICTFGVLLSILRRQTGFALALTAGVIGVMTHLHIHNLFDNLYVQGMYLHLAMLLALASSRSGRDRKRFEGDA